jgi:chromosome segregation ATPase
VGRRRSQEAALLAGKETAEVQLDLAHAAKRVLEREVAASEAEVADVRRHLEECEAARAAVVTEVETLRSVKEEARQLQYKVRPYV